MADTVPTDSTDGQQPQGILSVPSAQDNLETVAQKLTELAHVVLDGKNLAEATNFQAAAYQQRDPVALARINMSELQQLALDDLRAGNRLEPIDWTTATSNTVIVPGSVGRMAKRARALERIYMVEGITNENAMWYTENMPIQLTTIVMAVTKVINAEIALIGNQCSLTALELAELQTIHKIYSVVGQALKLTWKPDRLITRKINEAIVHINVRKRVLELKSKSTCDVVQGMITMTNR